MVTDDAHLTHHELTDSIMAKSQGVIRVSGNGLPASPHPAVTTASLLETVAEQVVEEGQQLVMGQVGQETGQHMVMVTQGDIQGQHQIMIADGTGQFPAGTQVIQLQGEQFVMRNFKTEPEAEDLSVQQQQQQQQAPTTRTINLEAGAQAIQASAAAAVQNVIRSLKDSDKMMLQQILPNHMLSQGPREQKIVIVDSGVTQEDTNDSDVVSSEVTPSKRSRGSNNEQVRVQIAKQYTPFGFHHVLEAPTAQWVRKDEDRCTYLNKGQFYGLTLEYRPNPNEPFHGDMNSVKSVVMLVFRDAKNPEDEMNAWDFWHQRQPSHKQRIIDAETNNMSDQCGIQHIEDVSFNAIAVYWNPLEKPAFISCAIQCLSTDFSLQKGVKGLPMHLQIDTYTKNPSDGDYDLIHRAYCQVKVFCDKGAERKFRQEERRAARKVAVGGQRVLEMYHQCQDRSEFYSMVDLSRTPVLFSPQPGSHTGAQSSQASALGLTTAPPGPGVSVLKSNAAVAEQGFKRRKVLPPPESRMVVYVRQENEEIFTPLHLVPPTVPGLARAIESKYNVSATAIRYLYRRNKKGITAKLDDDLLKFYCNEDTFLMQVTAIELEGAEGHESIMYDITLCELAE